MTGGTLSLLQLFLDAAIEERHHPPGHRAKEWLANVLGDSGKLGLSLLTLGFDAVLIFQHYYLYRGQPSLTFLRSREQDQHAESTSPDDEESARNHGTFSPNPTAAANSDAHATESSSLLRTKQKQNQPR